MTPIKLLLTIDCTSD